MIKIFAVSILFFFAAIGLFPADTTLDQAAAFKESFYYSDAINKFSTENVNVLPIDQKRFLARLYFLNGDDKKALETFSVLEAPIWQDLDYKGLCYEALGQNEMAVSAYMGSLKLKENSIASYRLGKIYFHRNDFAQAAQFFARTIAIDKSIHLAYYYLGKCQFSAGNFLKAHNAFAQATNFYPQKSDPKKEEYLAHDKLGQDYFDDKKKQKESKRQNFHARAYSRDMAAPAIRVGVAKSVKEVTFKCGENFLITDGKVSFNAKSEQLYTVSFQDNQFILKNYKQTPVLRTFFGTVKIRAKTYPFYVLDITVGAGNFWHRQLDGSFRGDLALIPAGATMTLVNVLSIEDYLCGVLPSEIVPDGPAEALKAQAVAARTIALSSLNRHKKEGFDVCSEVHCQAYGGMLAERQATTAAVVDTRGMILLYKKKPADAFYHANCGGCLRDDPFGARSECLTPKRDSDDPAFSPGPYGFDQWFFTAPQDTFSYTNTSNYRWQRIIDREDFSFLFTQDITSVKDFNLLGRGPCGQYSVIDFTTSAGQITLKKDLDIRNYFDGLRSAAFDLEVKYSADKKPQFLIFWGAGFGHGAGLSQDGAVKMGKLGRTYTDILKHYYPLAKIEKRY